MKRRDPSRPRRHVEPATLRNEANTGTDDRHIEEDVADHREIRVTAAEPQVAIHEPDIEGHGDKRKSVSLGQQQPDACRNAGTGGGQPPGVEHRPDALEGDDRDGARRP